MKRYRVPGRILRLCLSAMLAADVQEFLADGLRLGVRPGVETFCPLLICYLAGGFLSRRKVGWALLPPAGAAALLFRFSLTGEALSLSILIPAGEAVLLFILGRSQGEAWPASLGLPAAGLCLLSAAFAGWRGEKAAFPGACALLTLAVSLIQQHRESMEAGVHNAPGEPPMPYPRGIRWKNWLLIALFAGVALGVAAVPVLRSGADYMWNTAVTGTKAAVSGVVSSIRERADAPPEATASPSPSPEPTEEPTPEPTEIGDPVRSARMFRYIRFFGILSAAAILAAAAFLWRKRKKTGLSLKQLWQRWKAAFLPKEPETPYTDAVEKLLDWKELPQRARSHVISRVRRVRPKKFRLEELPDDRVRIRYTYRELLKSPMGKGYRPSMTPTEVGAALPQESIRALAQQYNVARYSPGTEIPAEAGNVAAAAMREVNRAARQRTGTRNAVRKKMEYPPVVSGEDRGAPKGAGVSAPAADTSDTLAILPAVPLWLPLADVEGNIRCAAAGKREARQAARAAGLSEELMHAMPEALAPEQQWLVVIARSLAAQAGVWEADLSELEPSAADRIAGVLQELSERNGIQIRLQRKK